MHPIENRDLEAHVVLCQERYARLEQRFEGIENRLDALHAMIKSIHDRVDAVDTTNNQAWQQARDVLIGILTATVAWLITLQFT
jgi:chromosome segregation ATPase